VTDEAQARPLPVWMTVVRGHPTADELAAVTLVVAAVTTDIPGPVPAPPPSTWVTRSRSRLRALPPPSQGSWRRAFEP
jgi:hypothetical protein